MTDSKAPRLLVFGATGYTGQALITKARARGLDTHAHLRPESPSAQRLLPRFDALGASCHIVEWSPSSIAELVRELAPSHVFCLLGTTRKKAAEGGEGATYAAVDVGMTLMALEGVAAMTPAARFVYLSAAGTGPKARGAYMRARWEVEQQVRARLDNWVIARPSFISGPDRAESRPGERFGAAIGNAALGLAGALGMGALRDRWASLSGAELASGLLHHALAATSDQRTVDASDLRGHA
jgi:nucleoside-diphosphate-sugar epimerase